MKCELYRVKITGVSVGIEPIDTIISHTGTRTRVGWVKTSYPNHLDYMGVEL
jgi:hypothetical protein